VKKKNPSHLLGIAHVIDRCGDTLFNDLAIGNESSAHCSLKALHFTLTIPDPSLRKSAVQKLSLSPFFSVLIASGRMFCPKQFIRVVELFREVDPFSEIDPPLQNHLTTALLTKQLSCPRFLSPHMGVFVLVGTLALIGDLFHEIPDPEMIQTMVLLFGQLFRCYFSKPTLLCAYLLLNLCPSVIHRNSDNEDAFLDCVKMAHSQEQERCRSNSRPGLSDHFAFGDGSSDQYPLLSAIGIEQAVELLTAKPERIDDAVLI
jgi:hypothetical protein